MEEQHFGNGSQSQTSLKCLILLLFYFRGFVEFTWFSVYKYLFFMLTEGQL